MGTSPFLPLTTFDQSLIIIFSFFSVSIQKDITPSQVIAWLQQPVVRVHVLLDSKGKTLSHAYVEVEDQRIAGAILRGEAAAAVGRKKGEQRGSVLGKGRRARGVTVTRSCQSELMTDVSPSPLGRFCFLSRVC